MKMKQVILSVVAMMAVTNGLAEAVIDNVSMRQRWPWSKKVDIRYTLTSAQPVDIRVAFFNNGQALSVSAAALSGDLKFQQTGNGLKHIVFDPTTIPAFSNTVLNAVTVQLTATESPLYKIVDLRKTLGSGEERIQNVTAYDLTNSASTLGSWELSEVDGQTTVIWTEVTNFTSHAEYGISKLIFRLVPASSIADVSVSRPYYASVFPITCGQCNTVLNNSFSEYFLPCSAINYQSIRGPSGSATNDYPGLVTPGTYSFIGVARQRTGLSIELPTETQWMIAVAPGETNVTWGSDGLLARARLSTNSTCNVGSLLPNRIGLYDMLGNVQVFVLDWGTTSDWPYAPTASGVDYLGSKTCPIALHLRKGLNYRSMASELANSTCLSLASMRGSGQSESSYNEFWGFRLVINE